MTRWSAGRAVLLLLLAAIAWAAIAVLCLNVGSTGGVGWPLLGQLDERLNRVLISSLVGAALAAAGVVYQAVLRNPLADPYLLGVSSGATLFSYLWQFPIMTGLLRVLGDSGGALSQQAFAFVGALLTVAIVFALATQRGRLEPITLLLVGVIVNAVNGSLFLLINAISRDRPGTGGEIGILIGRISTLLTQQQKFAALAVIGAGFFALMYISGQLNVAALGEAEAESLGVRIQRLRWTALVIASLVTASAVAISGPIGFIGLVCPHLGRLLVGGDVRRLLPAATALGAALLAAADAITRLLAGLGTQTLLPVGVLTALLGGPFFLLLLWQNRRTVAGGAR